jgi:hypothetical protein
MPQKCTVRALFVRCSCTVRALSVRCPCTVRALSVHCPCAVRALSVRCPCAVRALFVRCPCDVCVLSVHCPCTVCALSVHCPCTVYPIQVTACQQISFSSTIYAWEIDTNSGSTPHPVSVANFSNFWKNFPATSGQIYRNFTGSDADNFFK